MEQLGIANNREIIYQEHSLSLNWTKALARTNYLLVVFVDGKSKSVLFEIAHKAVVYGACYVCTIGDQAELLHDMIDDEIVFRQVDDEQPYLPPFDIITTYHVDSSEGLWYAIYAADHPDIEIRSVVCLDACATKLKSSILEMIN